MFKWWHIESFSQWWFPLDDDVVCSFHALGKVPELYKHDNRPVILDKNSLDHHYNWAFWGWMVFSFCNGAWYIVVTLISSFLSVEAICWSITRCLFTNITNASETIVKGTKYVNDWLYSTCTYTLPRARL